MAKFVDGLCEGEKSLRLNRYSQRICTDAADFNGLSVLICCIRLIRWESNCKSQAIRLTRANSAISIQGQDCKTFLPFAFLLLP
jgi:hypothetical protein